MNKTTWIIGNGFDRYKLELQTSFSHFILEQANIISDNKESLKQQVDELEKSIKDFPKEDTLEKFIKLKETKFNNKFYEYLWLELWNLNPLWSDVEFQIAIILDVYETKKEHYISSKDKVSLFDEFSWGNKFLDNLDIEKILSSNEYENLLFSYTYIYLNDLKYWVKSFSNGYKEKIIDFITEDKLYKNPSSIISFNYNDIEGIDGIESINIHGVWNNYSKNIVSGSSKEKLGEKILEENDVIKKSKQINKNDRVNSNQLIKESDNIYIIGHSLINSDISRNPSFSNDSSIDTTNFNSKNIFIDNGDFKYIPNSQKDKIINLLDGLKCDTTISVLFENSFKDILDIEYYKDSFIISIYKQKHSIRIK